VEEQIVSVFGKNNSDINSTATTSTGSDHDITMGIETPLVSATESVRAYSLPYSPVPAKSEDDDVISINVAKELNRMAGETQVSVGVEGLKSLERLSRVTSTAPAATVSYPAGVNLRKKIRSIRKRQEQQKPQIIHPKGKKLSMYGRNVKYCNFERANLISLLLSPCFNLTIQVNIAVTSISLKLELF
jgi:hypothetical protein